MILSTSEQIAVRIMHEMDRQHLNCPKLAKLMGLSTEYVHLRLGQAKWGRIGGRTPLVSAEIELFADTLGVPIEQLTGYSSTLIWPAVDCPCWPEQCTCMASLQEAAS
jgi:hypothetical protein